MKTLRELCSEAKPKVEPKSIEDRENQDDIRKKRQTKPPNTSKKHVKTNENEMRANGLKNYNNLMVRSNELLEETITKNYTTYTTTTTAASPTTILSV